MQSLEGLGFELFVPPFTVPGVGKFLAKLVCMVWSDPAPVFPLLSWVTDFLFGRGCLGPQVFEPRPVMAERPIRIGDQLVLEEDYDETYIPSEQGKRPGVQFEGRDDLGLSSVLLIRSVLCV